MNPHFSIVWHRLSSAWWESYLGIDTRGAVAPITSEGVHYTPLPYPMIFRMFQVLNLKRHDVFVDIGCGKGRVVCCACRLPVERVVALELNTVLLEQAIANVGRMRGAIAPVLPVCRSADEYDYADATVAYLYNPFNERITGRVIDALFASYTRRPRPMQVVYANPVHEAVLSTHGWLEKHAEWPATDFPVFGYRVSFWRTVS